MALYWVTLTTLLYTAVIPFLRTRFLTHLVLLLTERTRVFIIVGIVVIICANHLFHHLLNSRREQQEYRIWPGTIFFLLEGLYMARVVQTELAKEKETVHHYFHQHGMFGFGYFSLLLLLAWTEYCNLDLAEGAPVVKDKRLLIVKIISILPAIMSASYSSLAYMIMGASYSSLACIIETVPLTTGFYIVAILMGGIICYNTNNSSRVWSDSSVVNLVVLSSISGLILLVNMCIIKGVIVYLFYS